MRVKEIMSKGVKTVTSTSSAETAWQVMQGARIHHLVVKDGTRGQQSDGGLQAHVTRSPTPSRRPER